jgi:hypothetical protein
MGRRRTGWEGDGDFGVVGGSFGKGEEKGIGGSGRERVGD